jgi:serine/threonine-protein kinase
MIGKVIDGKFSLIGLLEKGDAFQSYLSHYHLLGNQVVVDLIFPSRVGECECISRLMENLDRALTIKSSCVSRVFSWGQEEDCLFVVREYTHGTLLTELIGECGDLPVEQSLNILKSVVAALAAVYGRGIYFLGINPHQIWIERSGATKILRPGYSFVLERADSRLSRELAIYWPPEVLKGEEGDRLSDIYCLGVLAKQLLPFFPRNKDLLSVVDRATSLGPSVRPPSSRVLVEDIEEVLSQGERTGKRGNESDHGSKQEVPGGEIQALARFEELVQRKMESLCDVGERQPRWRRIFPVKFPVKVAVLAGIILFLGILGFRLVNSAVRESSPGEATALQEREDDTEPVVVPDLKGLGEREALSLLEETGLYGEVYREPSNVVPEGKVVTQEPIRGKMRKRGEKVKLYVSSGPLNGDTSPPDNNPDDDQLEQPAPDSVDSSNRFFRVGYPLSIFSGSGDCDFSSKECEEGATKSARFFPCSEGGGWRVTLDDLPTNAYPIIEVA